MAFRTGRSSVEEKIKQRLMGVLALVGVGFIALPFLFHTPQPAAKLNLSTQIPKAAVQPIVTAFNALKIKPLQKTTLKPTLASSHETTLTPAGKTTPPEKTTPTVMPAAKTMPTTTMPTHMPTTQTTSTEMPAQKMMPIRVVQPLPKTHEITKTVDTVKAVESTSVKAVTAPPSIKMKLNTETKPIVQAKPLVKSKIATPIPNAWVVQLGVFSNKANAKKLVRKLRAQKFDAYTRSIKSRSGRTLIGIYVGPEISKAKIRATKIQLKKEFGINGIIKKHK